MQRRVLAEKLGIPVRRVTLVNDAVAALWGLTVGPRAVMIQLGTGFTAAWRKRLGKEETFDHLAVGGPFDLRFELPKMVARMLDGREQVTGLKARALRHYGVKAD